MLPERIYLFDWRVSSGVNAGVYLIVIGVRPYSYFIVGLVQTNASPSLFLLLLKQWDGPHGRRMEW